MKELDMLLGSFLRSQELALERGDWPDFESLLALEDDVLWDYLQSPASAPESFTGLIDGIRGRHVPSH
jgi:succinate dehydrogenase flavin-adding protein (antitoxin of CptAB toxin-antitoxin module)